ncbi:hypothetical protein KQX54_011957 [Cotesia glomerata]|uniref:RH1 domain-containing protein n=1 Tax=Cotesia glomerata TaxID=32391 RepID=A0AAV7HE31_COTGL|nr:hypothetical protein KQX54_011957 [Cotesia glomerata]
MNCGDWILNRSLGQEMEEVFGEQPWVKPLSTAGSNTTNKMDSFGTDAVTGLMPKVINALELLENLATKNEREITTVQELTARISQLENDKIGKAEDRQRFEKVISNGDLGWLKISIYQVKSRSNAKFSVQRRPWLTGINSSYLSTKSSFTSRFLELAFEFQVTQLLARGRVIRCSATPVYIAVSVGSGDKISSAIGPRAPTTPSTVF